MKKLLLLALLFVATTSYSQQVGIENSVELIKYVIPKLPKKPTREAYAAILKALPEYLSSKENRIIEELNDLDDSEALVISKMIPSSTPSGIKVSVLNVLDLLENKPVDYRTVRNLTYGSNIDWQGKMTTLKLDIYTPQAEGKYPLVIFMHGGGWVNGSKNLSSDVRAAKALAERGYVVSSIDYRLGWRTSSIECNNSFILGAEAIYRSIQDLKAAIRYTVSMARDFNIDTSNIYIMGSSAGAGSLLFNQYYTQEFWDTTFPSTKRLGKLEGITNLIKDKFTIKGLIPLWGGMISTNAITRQNAIPTFFIHGTADKIATYDKDYWNGCSNRPVAYGSKPLYEKLVSIGVPALAHIKTGGPHVVFTEQQWASEVNCFIKGIIAKKYVTGFYFDDFNICKNATRFTLEPADFIFNGVKYPIFKTFNIGELQDALDKIKKANGGRVFISKGDLKYLQIIVED